MPADCQAAGCPTIDCIGGDRIGPEHTEDHLEQSTTRTATPTQLPVAWTSIASVPIALGGPTNRYEPVPIDGGASNGVRWLERSVRRFPERIAVADDRVTLRYSELLDRIYGMAARIDAAVPPDGAFVSILHNGPAAAVAILAAICVGRTIIPIDAGHPVERQSAIFAAAGVSVVVLATGQEVDVGVLPASTVLIRLDVTEPTGADRPPDTTPDPRDPTIVVFTSGSSGNPKGVAHALHAESIAWFVEKFHLNEHDVLISLASMSQTGVADLMCLATGATLHIVDVRRRGISDALAVMGSAGVTFLSFVPSAIRMALGIPGIEHAFGGLRVLDLHGERILASDVALLRAKLPPHCRICVTYGATEVGGVFSWFVREEAITGEVVPIGYLCPNTAFALIDGDGASVPEGEVGELLIRGPIALGDWFDGRLVGGRFLPCPDEPGNSIYNMGDLVRLRPDGLAEFIGRRDRKVKIRGLWVDLDDVEAALRACEGIVDAVAVVHEAEQEADGIAAYVVSANPLLPPPASALRRSVAAATAEHMAPGRIRFVPAIPRLPNHKPDILRLQTTNLQGQTGSAEASRRESSIDVG